MNCQSNRDMTTYELIKSIEPGKLNTLVRAGVISPEWRRSIQVYDYFNEMCKTTGRMDAYDLTGQKYYMSDENVRKIVRKLQVRVE